MPGQMGEPKFIFSDQSTGSFKPAPLILLVGASLLFPLPQSGSWHTALWKVVPWRQCQDSYCMICLGFVTPVALICPAPGDLGWSRSLSALQTQQCEEQAVFPGWNHCVCSPFTAFRLGFRRPHTHDQTVRIVGV